MDSAAPVTLASAYDAVGNRTSSPLSAAHSVDAANRLTDDDNFDYAYDGNGNRAENGKVDSE